MRRWRAGVDPVGPLALDACLVVAVAGANLIAISTAREPSSRDPDAFAYGLGLMMAILLFGRRRWPAGTLLMSAALLIFYSRPITPASFP